MIAPYLVASVQKQRQSRLIYFFYPGANDIDLGAHECIRRTQRRTQAALQEGFGQRWTLVGQGILAIDQRDRPVEAVKAKSKCCLGTGMASTDNGDTPQRSRINAH
jgi:hypothetical protein